MGIGLQDGQTPPFAVGRIHGQPGRRQQPVPFHRRHVAVPVHNVLAETELGRVPNEPFPVRSVPDHVEDQSRMGRAKRGKRVEQQVQPLVRDEAAHTDDGRPVRRSA